MQNNNNEYESYSTEPVEDLSLPLGGWGSRTQLAAAEMGYTISGHLPPSVPPPPPAETSHLLLMHPEVGILTRNGGKASGSGRLQRGLRGLIPPKES